MDFPRNGVHFEFIYHFDFYVNYFKSETFLMPNKTFLDIFGLLQEIVLCRCLKRFFSIKPRPFWN